MAIPSRSSTARRHSSITLPPNSSYEVLGIGMAGSLGTATTTALTSSNTSPAPGTSITLTATVASSSAAGTVTFLDGNTVLGSANLASGVATYNVTSITQSNHIYTAAYGGSSTYAASTSPSLGVSALTQTTTTLTSSSSSPTPGLEHHLDGDGGEQRCYRHSHIQGRFDDTWDGNTIEWRGNVYGDFDCQRIAQLYGDLRRELHVRIQYLVCGDCYHSRLQRQQL